MVVLDLPPAWSKPVHKAVPCRDNDIFTVLRPSESICSTVYAPAGVSLNDARVESAADALVSQKLVEVGANFRATALYLLCDGPD